MYRDRYSPVGVKVFRGDTEVIGTDGVLLYWDNDLLAWFPTKESELVWRDLTKRLGINNSSPTSELDVTGTITGTRLLIGGITE
ncbi:hypothetical protein LCGC14_0346510 [marine sediment metagenome]|uniref:Uncharacterized protein n=1 Tax=marine sediment metagenome TaxID=412755 RepID=A0A0F9TI07_9ZZZZ